MTRLLDLSTLLIILVITYTITLFFPYYETKDPFKEVIVQSIPKVNQNDVSLAIEIPNAYQEQLKEISSQVDKNALSVQSCVDMKTKSFSFHEHNSDECFGKGIHDSIYAPFLYTDDIMLVHYPYPYSLLIDEPNFCSDSPFILFIHPSHPSAFDQRYTIRNSFGRISSVDNISVKHLFVMGTDKNSKIFDIVKDESQLYHDILVYNFQNSFLNVTLNVVLSMEWAIHNCASTHYFIRSDTDTWINIPYLIRNVISSYSQYQHKNIFSGYQINLGKPVRVPQSRYYISEKVYSQKVFPPYPTGCFYIFSMDVIQLFYKLSQTTKPVLYFDDVYLGILNQVAKVPFKNYNYPELFFNRLPWNPQRFFNISMASHRYTTGDLMFLWRQFCDSKYMDNNIHIQ